jgi:hypothetical protein
MHGIDLRTNASVFAPPAAPKDARAIAARNYFAGDTCPPGGYGNDTA